MLTYKNPTNGHKETVAEISKLWALLFGPAYFAFRGAWRWAIITFIISYVTINVSIVIYLLACLIIGLCATKILENHFNTAGWKLVKGKK